jgi:hypothetical protein
MKNKYAKFIGKADSFSSRTFVVQTTGNAPLSGDSLDVQDYSWHSYHVYPIGDNTVEGVFDIQVSNDNENWVNFAGFEYSNSGEANIVFSDQWHFKYARPVITGQGNYVINESHLA